LKLTTHLHLVPRPTSIALQVFIARSGTTLLQYKMVAIVRIAITIALVDTSLARTESPSLYLAPTGMTMLHLGTEKFDSIVALLTSTREMPSSNNVDRNIDWSVFSCFSWLSSVHAGKHRDSASYLVATASPRVHFIPPFNNHPNTRRYTVRATDSMATNRKSSLIRHRRYRKRVQQFFYCCVFIRCQGKALPCHCIIII
jgi:hypothetical protein